MIIVYMFNFYRFRIELQQIYLESTKYSEIQNPILLNLS